MRIAASQVAQWARGRLVNFPDGADVVADGLWFDSRTLPAHHAFVAVVAERDGHDFVSDAVREGAPFVIVATGRAQDGVPSVEVDDTVTALARVASEARSVFDGTGTPVVGVTGSAGKTSTKQFVAAVLSGRFPRVHVAEGSFNNDIGLPISVVNAPVDCDALVLEMGMRGPGEITRLCSTARPTVGVVTIIGDAHSERVGGVEGVARAKAELLEGISDGGVAVLNRDDDWFAFLESRVPPTVRQITFGTGDDADVRWSVASIDDQGCATVRFEAEEGVAVAVVPLPGRHMAANAAAAVAVGTALGMGVDECVRGLSRATGAPGRSQWRMSSSGVRVLDDSYNANSASVRAALDVLASVGAARRVAVLGRMAEVSDPAAAHRAVAERAASLGIDVVPLETDLFGAPAMSLDQVLEFLADLGADDVVLVKGSLISGTRRVVDAIVR